MKCQSLFSGEREKNINLSSAELAQRVVKVEKVPIDDLCMSGKFHITQHNH